MMKIEGRIWKFGADVDTDAIIPARYLNTSDPKELAKHAMEEERPEFIKKVKKGDLLIAAKNFGCGSSREHAPIALKAGGDLLRHRKELCAHLYRNGFNQGLPLLESAEAWEGIEDGDRVRVDLDTGEIFDLTKKKRFVAKPVPPFMQELVKHGGLIPHLRRKTKRKP